MKDMREILKKIRSARYIDLTFAFHLILLAEQSKQYAAFSVPSLGLVQYKQLPFGLSGSPARL